jgi:hypothetical protein
VSEIRETVTLQALQSVLFKIYLNPGYRLAHRIDPASFADHMQLSEEHAELVRNVSPSEVEEFVLGLESKQLLSLSISMPTTYKWLEENHPVILREFQEISTFSRLASWDSTARRLAEFVRECHDFYDEVPAALPDVAQLELLLLSARKEQELRGTRTPGPTTPPPPFSWDSLYWKPSRTSMARLSVDALSVLLGKKTMTDPGEPTWVVISPAPSGRMPIILRITAQAYHILSAMEEPVSARQLHSHARVHDLNVSEQALQTMLTRLVHSHVIGSHHVRGADGGA